MNGEKPEQVHMVVPRWMVKQMWGKAIHDSKQSSFSRSRQDSEKIAELLRHYLDNGDGLEVKIDLTDLKRLHRKGELVKDGAEIELSEGASERLQEAADEGVML